MRASGLALIALATIALGARLDPASAAVRYIAFGDSNTRGNDCKDPGGANPPTAVFDTGTGCKPATPCNQQTQDDADQCGYAYRLVNQIAGGVPTAEVINAGSGGETVVQGVSRIDSRISAGDDVLILIEGTNDISKLLRGDIDAISPQEIANLMGLMIDKATALGMDSIVGSPIRRVCPEFPGLCSGFDDGSPGDPRPEANPDEPQTAALDLDVADLASTKNRTRISPWFFFGGDQANVDTDYFQDDLRFGHIDNTGYLNLAKDILKKNITGTSGDDAIGAPNPLSPIGETDDTGVFTWDDYANPERGATLWQLQIDGPLGGTFHDEFYEHIDVCAAGTCSVDVGTLSIGSYSWKVRGKNLRGPSPYSADTAFTVTGGPLPGGTTLVYPLDDIYQTDPPFRWLPATSATDYRLHVDGNDTLVSSASCTASLCTATRGVALSFGFHAWSVQPMNQNGDGPETPLEAFDVLECTMPFDLVLDADDVGTGSFFTTCDQIQGRDGYKIQNGENVTLHGGEEVVLFDTFMVESGGALTIRVDH